MTSQKACFYLASRFSQLLHFKGRITTTNFARIQMEDDEISLEMRLRCGVEKRGMVQCCNSGNWAGSCLNVLINTICQSLLPSPHNLLTDQPLRMEGIKRRWKDE